MRAIERLPIILETLGTAYDLLVVECGPAGPQNIRRLVADGAAIFLSAIEPNADLADMQIELENAGFGAVTLVRPEGTSREAARERPAA